MADLSFAPTAAASEGRWIVLTNGAGNRLRFPMPTEDGATVCAVVLDNEFKRARRTG